MIKQARNDRHLIIIIQNRATDGCPVPHTLAEMRRAPAEKRAKPAAKAALVLNEVLAVLGARLGAQPRARAALALRRVRLLPLLLHAVVALETPAKVGLPTLVALVVRKAVHGERHWLREMRRGRVDANRRVVEHVFVLETIVRFQLRTTGKQIFQ